MFPVFDERGRLLSELSADDCLRREAAALQKTGQAEPRLQTSPALLALRRSCLCSLDRALPVSR